MTHPDRDARSHLGITLCALGTIALVVTACGSAAGSSTPGGSPSPVPTASAAATATTAPTANRTPATTPAPSSSAVACAALPQTVEMPSDRLISIEGLGLPGRDLVRFSFGNGSLTPAGPPSGLLERAVPPFSQASSGLPIDLEGDHAVQVVFKGMSIMNDVGEPTFDGARQIVATDPKRSLREAIIFDESEGQVGWYIGYDGPSCVTVSREGDDVIVAIDFGPGS